MRAGDAVLAVRSQRHLQLREVGMMLPERNKTDRLVRGQVCPTFCSPPSSHGVRANSTKVSWKHPGPRVEWTSRRWGIYTVT